MKRAGLFVNSKDVQRITGRGEAYARRVLRKIRMMLGKKSHQLVTLDEFCEFIGTTREEAEEYL